VATAVEPDNGKIVVLTDSALERFNPNGTIDTSFGTDGSASIPTQDADGNSVSMTNVAVSGNGQVVVAGAGSDSFVVGVYTSSGTMTQLDPAAHDGPSLSDLEFRGSTVALSGNVFIWNTGWDIFAPGSVNINYYETYGISGWKELFAGGNVLGAPEQGAYSGSPITGQYGTHEMIDLDPSIWTGIGAILDWAFWELAY